jgi:formyl-CoA transferase
MYGAMAAVMAVYHRDLRGGKGQMIDVALYEAVFSLMESMLPEYGMLGFVRERSGAALPGIVPSNTYLCSDGGYVVIGGNNDSIFKRLMKTIGRDDLANDPQLATNAGRVPRAEELDRAIGAWTGKHSLDAVLTALEQAQVPAGRIYSIKDIVEDLHYRARGMIERHKLPTGEEVLLPGIVPKFSGTPGTTRWIGPALGAHTGEVLSSLGYDTAAQQRLKAQGVI